MHEGIDLYVTVFQCVARGACCIVVGILAALGVYRMVYGIHAERLICRCTSAGEQI